MDRRIASQMWMLLFLAGLSEATTLTFDLPTPYPGNTVEITVTTQGCSPFLETEVRTPKGNTNGLIRVSVVDVCECIATPPITPPLKAKTGPLPLGTYTTELLGVSRNPEDPTCTGSTLIETGQLVVSYSGQIGALRTEPQEPRAGQPVTAVIGSYCPMAWKPAEITTVGTQRIVSIAEDPDGAVPPVPCSSNPTAFEHRISLGPLEAGSYWLQLLPVPVYILEPFPLVTQHAFTVDPPGPGLSLQGDRFRVRAAWSSAERGDTEAVPVPLTRESGYFWFANADNVELVAKVLDGCAVNGRYWVFLAGLTNLEVTVTVDDILTGATRSYTNALGTPFLPVQDTDAFEGCELGDRR